MSIKIMSLVWERYPAGGGELLTALAYADHAHDDGTGIRPSVAHIAKKTRQSERSVQRYLAHMREVGWLITVRHGDGGRGYATEYRVNPQWITNPAKLSPFHVREGERVTDEVVKGDTGGSKRVTLVSPQPSITINKPTTTADDSDEPGALGLQELKWPSLLGGPARQPAMKILENCPVEDRQQVLNEIAGIANKGSVRYPVGLLRKLVDLAKQGQFFPSAALEYQRKLESDELAIELRQTAAQRRKQRASPEALESARAHISAVRQRIKDSPPRPKGENSP